MRFLLAHRPIGALFLISCGADRDEAHLDQVPGNRLRRGHGFGHSRRELLFGAPFPSSGQAGSLLQVAVGAVQPATIVPRPLLDCGQRTAKWFVSSEVRLAASRAKESASRAAVGPKSRYQHISAPWCNGSTAVFGTACPGSNPGGVMRLPQRSRLHS